MYVVHCGDHQLMITSPGQQQAVIDFLDKYTIMEDLEVEDITGDTVMLTMTGPEASEILERAQPAVDLQVELPVDPDDPQRPPVHQLVFFDPDAADRAAEDPAQLPAPWGSARPRPRRCGSPAGQPAYGSEMSDTYNPLEAGLIGAIDFHKGCYIGQEVIARLDTYHKVQKYMVTLRFEFEHRRMRTEAEIRRQTARRAPERRWPATRWVW